MSILELLQQRLIMELNRTKRDECAIEETEELILSNTELKVRVAQRAHERRGLPTVPDYDLAHTPGVLRKHMIERNGKEREVFSQNDADYCQAQYLQRGIIGSVADQLVHSNTYAYVKGRGVETAITDAIGRTWTSPDCMWFQEDITDCFRSVPVSIVEGAFPPRAWTYIQMVRGRFRELVSDAKGLPQGHSASASCVNVVLHKLLLSIRQRHEGVASILIYSDDITVTAPRSAGLQIIAEIKAALAAHGMELNSKKSRVTRPAQGQAIALLGYLLEWQKPRGWPLIRPQRKAYQKLADSLSKSLDSKQASAITDGWDNAYRLTNDPRHHDRRRSAIEDGIRRWRETATHSTQGPGHRGTFYEQS